MSKVNYRGSNFEQEYEDAVFRARAMRQGGPLTVYSHNKKLNRQNMALGTPKKVLNFTPRKKQGKTVSTPGGSKMKLKRMSSVTGRAAGKVKKIPKIRKRYRRKMNKYVFRGVEKTVEAYKNESTTTQSVTFVHGTFVRDQVLEMAWKAVVKKFFEQQKVYIVDWTNVAEPYNATDWRISVSYHQNGVGLTSTLNMAGTTTYTDIVFWLGQNTRPWNDINSNIELDYLQVNSQGTTIEYRPFARMNLRRTKIHFEVKSSLKMQNRTINSTGNNESDDVDNVPLIGKIYQFKGTGLVRPKVTGDSQIYINDSNGYAVAAEIGNYREPIDGLYYDKIKRQGKIKLEPGHIKTSVLTQKSTMFLSTLLEKAVAKYTNANPKLEVGVCRAFSFEKLIDTLNDGNALGINLGIELNNRFRATATLMPTYVNVPEYTRVAL